jgi:hypothetical protein
MYFLSLKLWSYACLFNSIHSSVMTLLWGLTPFIFVELNVLCGGGSEYLHRSPASRKRRQKANSVPGGITGPPVPGGHKYRNLVLHVEGVSKIETIKYAHESRGTQVSERLPGKNWKLQTRLLIREGAPHKKPRNCLKIIKETMWKTGRGSQMGAWHQDGLADWLSFLTLLWLCLEQG